MTIVAAYTPEEPGAAEVKEDGTPVELEETPRAAAAPAPEPGPAASVERAPSRDWLTDVNAAKSREELRPVFQERRRLATWQSRKRMICR
ncbi:MAG: hypothetical protein AAGC61_02900 [Microbacterium sp.]